MERKGKYTSLPIKWETYDRLQIIFNKMRMEGKLKYYEEFINLALDKLETN
jgi:hypothetical protein